MSLEPQGIQHQLAVEKCFINAKRLGYNIDEDFIQPILDQLVSPNEEMSVLAAISLSFIPQDKVIVFKEENKFKLLLAESLNDATMRFFIACGNRQEYLQDNHEVINKLFDYCFD